MMVSLLMIEKRCHSGHVMGTNLSIGDPVGVKGATRRRFRSTHGRRTALVGDGQSSRNLCYVRCLRNPRIASIKRRFHQTAEGGVVSLASDAARASFKRRLPERSPIRCESRLQQSRELAAKTRMNLLRDSHPVNANFPSARLRLALYSPNGKP